MIHVVAHCSFHIRLHTFNIPFFFGFIKTLFTVSVMFDDWSDVNYGLCFSVICPKPASSKSTIFSIRKVKLGMKMFELTSSDRNVSDVQYYCLCLAVRACKFYAWVMERLLVCLFGVFMCVWGKTLLLLLILVT